MGIEKLVICFVASVLTVVAYTELGIHSLLSLLVAVLVHEIGHIAAIYVLGNKVGNIRLEPSGLKIEYMGILSKKDELCSALAGPLGGLVFFFAAKHFDALNLSAQISLIYSLFNLLPIFPLDGGRVLYINLANKYGHSYAEKITHGISLLFGFVFFTFGIFYMLRGDGNGMFAAGIWLLIMQSGN